MQKNTNLIQKILLITGENAYENVKTIDFAQFHHKYQFQIAKVSIGTIAFLSKRELQRFLTPYKVEDFDFIIVSGLIPWNLNDIPGQFRGKLKKGPKFIGTFPEILKTVPISDFSATEPADVLMHKRGQMNINQIISSTKEKLISHHPQDYFNLSETTQDTLMSSQLPLLLIGEIVDFPKYSEIDLIMIAERYIQQGVQVLDLGCIANENNGHLISKMIKSLKTRFNVPLSIDSIDPNEIKAAVLSGASMVLSITIDNYDQLFHLSKEITLVIIPYSHKEQIPIHNSQKIIERLLFLEKEMRKQGFKRILLDPITHSPISPGLVNSLATLIKLNEYLKSSSYLKNLPKNHPRSQLLMGFGNVSELIDGDSPGINTLLSLLATEINVAAILSTEASNKTRHSFEELQKSIQLAFLAKSTNQPPINLGVNAFSCKFKHDYPNYIPTDLTPSIVPALKTDAIMDPKGFFKIFIDELEGKIIVSHLVFKNKLIEEAHVFKGENAESIYKSIIKLNLISRLDHAAYIGKELAHAEYALIKGSEYVQE